MTSEGACDGSEQELVKSASLAGGPMQGEVNGEMFVKRCLWLASRGVVPTNGLRRQESLRDQKQLT
jgi:hypothetical protein